MGLPSGLITYPNTLILDLDTLNTTLHMLYMYISIYEQCIKMSSQMLFMLVAEVFFFAVVSRLVVGTVHTKLSLEELDDEILAVKSGI